MIVRNAWQEVASGLRQVVEFLYLRKADIDNRLAFSAGISNRRQFVKGLWTEYHIHIRCSFTDGGSFLARYTATDGNL